ncbi:hypothetical protein L873DRAFT_1795034 [Choiromyces venosus 120613-1]|uniref:Chitin-binding type-1 domain-containing protein n=1 Tax=Choiromyces venosus 120613-1 TaxID=1336337 RepID=A0A3N4J3Z6_9PEZI|nr:hypothetical protein L873DRAFT_1795034 [Choiromyces venosus 120613-1]
MKSLYLSLALFMALLVAANPVPNPTADPNPDPVAVQFYGASLTGIPLKRRDEAPVQARDEEPKRLVKRTQSPISGPDANKCGTNTVNGVSFTCMTGNAGLCCSGVGWCGSSSWYCGGACQVGYGSCVTPYLQLTYDADAGDSIWDVVSDNVFDAAVGDGLLYYGATPSGGWPA